MTNFAARRLTGAFAIATLLICAPSDRAQADGMGRGVGAMQGAIIGDLIGGSSGAAVGAAVGAMIGAEGKVSREEEHMDQQRTAADERLAQWEAEQDLREIEARERAEKEERLASQSPQLDLDLLLDVQIELMDRDYDIGVVGMQSGELTTAIVTYQESQELTPDGSITTELLEHMRGDGQ